MATAVLGCRKAFISIKYRNNCPNLHQMLFDPVNLWKEKSLIKKPRLGPPLPLKVEYSLHCPGLNDQLLLKYKSTGKIIIKKLSLKFSVCTFVAACMGLSSPSVHPSCVHLTFLILPLCEHKAERPTGNKAI